MAKRSRVPRDLTVLAIPVYFGTIAVEHLWLRRRAARQGASAGDYEHGDTIASLSMGVGSLVVPLVTARLLRPFTPGRGRLGKAVVATAAGAAAATTVADIVVRRLDQDARSEDTASRDVARRVAAAGGVTTVVCGGVALATFWSSRTMLERFWRRRFLPSMGTGPLAVAAAVAGWDFIYYWNHRLMHQSRYMWALHVVHHSSEHYNLSTALRQPVADSLSVALPYGALCLVGVPPDLVKRARDLNLLYQYWIHTETIRRIGRAEAVLNTPSHHRVHHGSNRRYLDRNHGSILIIWDRLFGTFEPEREPVVYGLTENIRSFNVNRIATHEYVDMLRDVANSTGWIERFSYVLRGPGWAKEHRRAVGDRIGAGRANGVPPVATTPERSAANGHVPTIQGAASARSA